MKKKKWLFIFLLLLFVIGVIVYLIWWNPFISMKRNGKDVEVVSVFQKYKDPFVQATFLGKDISKKVKVKGRVNTDKVGTYTLWYQIKVGQTVKKVKRRVEVVDKEAPRITLNGDTTVELFTGDTYEEKGCTVVDNYDKDVQKLDIVGEVDTNKVGEYTIVYQAEDASGNKASMERKVIVKEKVSTYKADYGETVMGPTYIKGILLVNKTYALPSTFAKGTDAGALKALQQLQEEASRNGYSIPTISGYRSYQRQVELYNNYVKKDGVKKADTYSARPGHSEHQTGLTFDIGSIDNQYGETQAGKWLANHCHQFGFIIRYPKGKEMITGFQYEPWHVRYVGVEAATEIYNKGITLEQYLGVYK